MKKTGRGRKKGNTSEENKRGIALGLRLLCAGEFLMRIQQGYLKIAE